MPKKRLAAAHQASHDDEDMYNLPLVLQQQKENPQLVQSSAIKKNKPQQLRPAPESESDGIEPDHDHSDNSSENNGSEHNESDDDLAPAVGSGSGGNGTIHDKR